MSNFSTFQKLRRLNLKEELFVNVRQSLWTVYCFEIIFFFADMIRSLIPTSFRELFAYFCSLEEIKKNF